MINNNVKLEVFLYILLRDYITFGELEEILSKHVDKVSNDNKPVFSNEFIIPYMIEVLKNRLGV